MIQYALAFAADAALHQDLPGVQEHISLLMVGLEQAAMDQGRWELAFQLMLVEDPAGDLCLSRRIWSSCNYWEGESFLGSVSAEMDNGGFGIYQRIGLYPREEGRGHKESSSARSRAITEPEEEAEVPKVKRGRSRCVAFTGGAVNQDDYEGLPYVGPGVASNVGGTMYGEFDKGVTNVPMSLHAWSWSLTRCLLRGRTSFSLFLRRSLGGCLGGPLDVAATALFPIPLPRDVQGVFGPQRFGKARRFRAAVRRMVHLAVMALNFLHCGGGLDYELLRRSPSEAHIVVYQRLEALIKAGGPPDSISIVGSN